MAVTPDGAAALGVRPPGATLLHTRTGAGGDPAGPASLDTRAADVNWAVRGRVSREPRAAVN